MNSFLYHLHLEIKWTIISIKLTEELITPKLTNIQYRQGHKQNPSGIKIPEIHGANKGLDPHVQPGKQRPLPSLPIHSIDKGLPTHPIPKPRIGQGRAGLRRKVKTHQPISLP